MKKLSCALTSCLLLFFASSSSWAEGPESTGLEALIEGIEKLSLKESLQSSSNVDIKPFPSSKEIDSTEAIEIRDDTSEPDNDYPPLNQTDQSLTHKPASIDVIDIQGDDFAAAIPAPKAIEIDDDESTDNPEAGLAKDPAVMDVMGVKLSQRDLNTLHPEQWLTGDIINACIRLKNNQLKIFQKPQKTAILETYFFQKIRAYGSQIKPGPFSRWLKKHHIHLNTLEKLLIPVGTDAHWFLMVINLNEKRIEIHDSLGTNTPSEETIMVQDWWLWYSHCFGIDGSTYEIVTYHAVQQPNGYDCGVYTIMAIASIVCDQLPEVQLVESGIIDRTGVPPAEIMLDKSQLMRWAIEHTLIQQDTSYLTVAAKGSLLNPITDDDLDPFSPVLTEDEGSALNPIFIDEP